MKKLSKEHILEYKNHILYVKFQCSHGVPLCDVLRSLGYIDKGLKVEEKKMANVKEEAFSVISNPAHYCEGRKYEPKDVIRDWDLNFNLGNAVKYISRNGRKSGESALKDLKKARQYLDFEIEAMAIENAEASRKEEK